MPKIKYSDEQINLFITGVYVGAINIYHLPKHLYFATADVLLSAYFKGIKQPVQNKKIYTGPDKKMLQDIRTNLYHFSASKTVYQVAEFQALMIENNETLSLEKFKSKAWDKWKVINESHLTTEYTTVLTASISAMNFDYAEQNVDIFPRLESVAIIDKSTTPECLRMNGVVADVSDPIWNHNLAPRHFNCFPAGTKILTKNGYKNIESIKINDLVIGGSGDERRVGFVHRNNFSGELVAITVENYRVLSTKNHRILTIKGWKRAENISLNDVVVQNIQVGFLNKLVSAINNLNVLATYLLMSFKRKRIPVANTFNSNPEFGNKDIRKSSVNGFVANCSNSIFSQKVKHYFFAFCWSFMILAVPFWILYAGVVKSFHSFTRNGMFFTEHWMRKPFARFCKFYRSVFSSFGIINPLGFNSLTTSPKLQSEMSKNPHQGSVVNGKLFTDKSTGSHFGKVQSSEGFSGGAPLNEFNTFQSFLFHSFFHRKLVLVNNITNIQHIGTVYNLSINKDETYITNVGVVHNCRCYEKLVDVYDPRKSTGAWEKKRVIKANDEAMSPEFKLNPAKDKVIFKERGPNKHPYFIVSSQYKSLAKHNYNLPIPK